MDTRVYIIEKEIIDRLFTDLESDVDYIKSVALQRFKNYICSAQLEELVNIKLEKDSLTK